MSMLDRPYTVGEVYWLLAEQAHRYQEDLSRLGDERDEAVAQHDRDAETIGELRGKITTWGNLYEATKQRVTEYAGYLKLAEGVAAALPDPDAQNPEHLRWAAEILADWWNPDRERGKYPDLSRDLRRKADRLEAAQREKDADEKLIEQAAQVMSDAADRGSMSLSWDRLPDSIRDGWRHNARALHAAGLLALDAARAEAGQ